MAVVYESKKIVLKEDSAKKFVSKLKSKDLEASKKRDTFLKQSKEKLNIINHNNVVTISVKGRVNNR